MGSDYGPWVRHDWCPRCARRTEQSRWHLRAVSDERAHRIRCHECAEEFEPTG